MISLCIPPASSIQIYPAVPCLVAALRKNNFEVTVQDLNIKFFDLFAKTQNLQIDYSKLSFIDHGYIVTYTKYKEIQENFNWILLIYEKILMAMFKLIFFQKDAPLKTISGNEYQKMLELKDNFQREIDLWISQLKKNKTKVVGFSIMSHIGLFWSILMAKLIKERINNIAVIFGGSFMAYMGIYRNQLLKDYPFINYIVWGDGEEALLNIVKFCQGENIDLSSHSGIISSLRHSSLTQPYKCHSSLDEIPFPDYSDLNFNLYPQFAYKSPYLPIVRSRGCPYKCTFCSERNLWRGYRERSPQNVVAEIKFLKEKYRVNTFRFNDSLIDANPFTLEKMCDLIIDSQLKIKWIALARLRSGLNKKLLEKMYQSGCQSLWYGLESASANLLSKMNKQANLKEISKIIKDTHSSGIQAHIFLIADFPEETKKDIDLTIQFLEEHKNYITSVRIARFSLLLFSEVYKHPQDYGLDIDIANILNHRNIDNYLLPKVFYKTNHKQALEQAWNKIKKTRILTLLQDESFAPITSI